ncbi:endonuclease/exonuclease/phosphatase family protein [Flavobacterium sp. MAH-1]|uniref:Endonuclease/exonuclease/phosphatase family protein n=1 Tax=Flavobacterium agri TaxID=2743471 RepID=A0A7Y8Y0A9_9FLAO|nr:endonuclease/exonuclease/phosphatase family protein [Flavobacterium agri]NUY80017.1 endonuclease/exonuclease/phosphatase family protein [Flavobacterium agri]NYA70042.1 endonuclease/exonuclease/phosphatase family protein [Flavobacterium agri]
MKLRFFFPMLLLLMNNVQSQAVKVMSYNIRVDFGGDGENNWEFRRDFLADQISYNNPDFIGTQEGKLHQLKYLDSALVDHEWIGRGRDNSETQGEYSAIFYNKKKFKLISQNTFWLSETPDVPESKSWETAYPRICTYGLFEDLKSKKRFYVVNTHLDHISEPARENGTKLILERISKLNTKRLPVILTGDFNSEMSSGAYKTIVSQMNDARNISKTKPFGPSGTFSGFKFHEPVTLLIDYIFTSKGNIEVLKFAVLSDSKNCKYPSDHLPVLAELKI